MSAAYRCNICGKYTSREMKIWEEDLILPAVRKNDKRHPVRIQIRTFPNPNPEANMEAYDVCPKCRQTVLDCLVAKYDKSRKS